ncbi:MAG: YHYH protein, partial [Myxococcota bacterium]
AAADGSAVDVLGSGDIAFISVNFDHPVHVFLRSDLDEDTGQPLPGSEPVCPECSEEMAYTVFGTGTGTSESGSNELGYYAPVYLDRDAAKAAEGDDVTIVSLEFVEYPGVAFFAPENYAASSDIYSFSDLGSVDIQSSTESNARRRLSRTFSDFETMRQARFRRSKEASVAAKRKTESKSVLCDELYPETCHYSMHSPAIDWNGADDDEPYRSQGPEDPLSTGSRRRRLQQAAAAGVQCASYGSDYEYAEYVTAGIRTVITNHCPNHKFTDLNPNTAVNEERTYTYPAYPKYDPSVQTSLVATGGAIGTLFNGAMLYSPYAGPSFGAVISFETSAVYGEGDTFDECGCHSSETSVASYHCHIPPSCLLNQLRKSTTRHSPQIGWAVDGFPVYGPRGPGGVLVQTCTLMGGDPSVDFCLDDCGGYFGEMSGVDDFTYRYYVLGEYHSAADEGDCVVPVDPLPSEEYYPFTPICLNGCLDPTYASIASANWVATCSSAAVDGYGLNHEPYAHETLEIDESFCTKDAPTPSPPSSQPTRNDTSTPTPQPEDPGTTHPLFADLFGSLEREKEVVGIDDPLPVMALDTRNDTASFARYAGGSGTKALMFVYEVGDQDSTAALEYVGVDALLGGIFRAPRGATSAIGRFDDVTELKRADLRLPRRGSRAAMGGLRSGTPLVMHNAPRTIYIAVCPDVSPVVSAGQAVDIRVVF